MAQYKVIYFVDNKDKNEITVEASDHLEAIKQVAKQLGKTEVGLVQELLDIVRLS